MARPSPLPFPLSNPTTQQAMENLGINSEDLVYRTLQYFTNSESNQIAAKRAYEIYVTRREELIQNIREERIKILSVPINDQPAKEAPEVLVERYRAQINEQQLLDKEATNKAILRRLAINQLRRANRMQKCENVCSRVDNITKAFTEQKTRQIEQAQLTVDTRHFERRQRPETPNQDFYRRRPNVDHEELYKTALAEKKKKFEEEVRRTDKESEEARKRQESQLNAVIEKRRKRIERMNEVETRYREMNATRTRMFEERAEIRDERARLVSQRQKDFEKARMEQAMRQIANQEQRFQSVKDAAKNERQKRIQAERAILDRRNEAAAKIFKRKEDSIEDCRRKLEKRDGEVAQRLGERKVSVVERLADERGVLEQKTMAVRQAKRARECASAHSIRVKLSRNDSGLGDVRRQRVASELAKQRAEERFVDTRNELLSVGQQFAEMNDSERVETLMRVLKVTQGEALEMLEVARGPASLH